MHDTSLILHNVCQQIALSDTAKETVKREYKSLGELISNSELINSEVDVKPQGSYNLGTAIKPINGSDDDFDIDLVAILHESSGAKDTKKNIGNVLKNSSLYSKKLLPEKKRAWTIEYSNSHVDVVPAIYDYSYDISVTNKVDNNNYEYRQSSPFKFKEWFCKRGENIYQSVDNTDKFIRGEVEDPAEYGDYTILQKIVQLLKFHRNKMFEKRSSDEKPISMIITILAAKAYSGQTDLSLGLEQVVNNLRKQISFDSDNEPHILNPVNQEEDFTDKWNDHPERREAFFEWLESVENDLGTIVDSKMVLWEQTLSNIYGDYRVRNAFMVLGEIQSKAQREEQVPLSSEGVFGGKYSGEKVRKNTFWGD